LNPSYALHALADTKDALDEKAIAKRFFKKSMVEIKKLMEE
jgi:hypothetical protein